MRRSRVVVVASTTGAGVAAQSTSKRGRDIDIFITPGYRFRVVDVLITNSTCPSIR